MLISRKYKELFFFGVKIYRDKDCTFFEIKLGSKSSLSFKKHSHEEYSLGIVKEGETSFWYDGRFSSLSANDIVFLPPALIHSCNPVNTDRWKFKMLFIEKEWLRSSLEGSGLELDSVAIRYAQGQPLSSSIIDKLMANLTERASPLEKEEFILSLVQHVMENKKTCLYPFSEMPMLRLKQIREYINDSFLEKITLDDLENISGLKRFAVIKGFKDVFTIPPHAYQTLLRVNYAKKELKKGRPLLEVALESGFYDQSHFIKVFKSHVGLTPHRYKSSIA